MNDLDICKRIAEIDLDSDFIEVYEDEYDGICVKKLYCGLVIAERYNPLTDDALCFQLMVKYNIEINRQFNAVYVVNRKDDDSIVFIGDMVLNKAICLAIIEAHNQ